MTQQILDIEIVSEVRPKLPIYINPIINQRLFYKYSGVLFAFIALMLIIVPIVFAGYLSPHHPTGAMNLSNRQVPPFWLAEGTLVHPLGTDNLGRDMLSRTLHGGQISLLVSFSSGTISAIIGITLGMIGGYMGGTVDRMLIGLTDIWLSFPFLVMALAVIATVGNSVFIMITLLSAMGWVHSARVTRGHTIQIMQSEYVQASFSCGASSLHIIRYHILPNVLNVNIIMWTFSIGMLIVIEGSLSFIGFGISGSTPSWGSMLSDGQAYLRTAWWIAVFPGFALMLTVLGVNFLGDALQKFNNHQFQ